MMAGKTGGLLKLDAICAKLKNSQDGSELYTTRAGTDIETNNNEKAAGSGEEASPTSTSGSQEKMESKEEAEVNGMNGIQGGKSVEPNGMDDGKADAECDPFAKEPGRLGMAEVSVRTPSSALGPCRSLSLKKNKRKNFRPKSIAQWHDASEHDDIGKDDLEIEEYAINNKGVDFNAIANENNQDSEELPLELTNHSGGQKSEQRPDPLPSPLFVLDNCGALDLSTCSRPSDGTSLDDDGNQPQDLSTKANSTRPCSDKVTLPSSDKVTLPNEVAVSSNCSKRDASVMKDYATNTMNELMRIYGFGDEGESIAQGVPLEKFESQSILGHEVSPRSITLGSGLQGRGSPGKGQVAREAVGVSASEAVKIAQEVHAKFLDSIANMPKLSQGNPPVLLADKAQAATSHGPAGKPRGQLEVGQSTATASITSISSPLHAAIPASASRLPELPGKPPGKLSPGSSNFASSAAYVKACFDPTLGPRLAAAAAAAGASGKNALPDYSKYVKRYLSYEECGGNHCHDMGYREHFHCMDCSFRVFVKKEEMIRHFKWHKKRDDSLQHGFMRYSPVDDCMEQFGPCTHNGRQTHYHCLQSGCTKVYISTSDVQMHANYHRKDSAIIQEGFQRFRATEDCGTPKCSFYGQRTTHFHCRRDGCSFTFKNKADMEKHKSYHQKDELLARDGFKKFMKYESCGYANCRYSKISNHIHCTRPGCDYVLHSTGQLYPHKRKHERRDFEHAYKRFREEQKAKPPRLNPAIQQQLGVQPASASAQASSFPLKKQEQEFVNMEEFAKSVKAMDDTETMPTDLSISESKATSPLSKVNVKEETSTSKAQASTIAKLASKLTGQSLNDSLNLPIPPYRNGTPNAEVKVPKEEAKEQLGALNLAPPVFAPMKKPSPPVNEKKERDESWKKFLTRYTANDPCHSRCQFLYKDHYHCNLSQCGMLFKSKDGVREHAKQHESQERITGLSFVAYEADAECSKDCPFSQKQKHYHCLWADCKHVISDKEPVFSRLEHHKCHEFARTMRKNPALTPQDVSLRRRRGRPPKYPKNEIPVVPKIEMTEEEIAAAAATENGSGADADTIAIAQGFQKFDAGQPCPDDKCMYFMRQHYHCLRKRCHHSTDRADVLTLHAKDFHSYITIMEGFEFFDRNVNCRRPHCHNNKANRHYHCVRPRCDYSFVRHSTMAQHDHKHKMAEMGLTPSPTIAIPKSAIMSPGVKGVPMTMTMQPVAMPVATPLLVSSPTTGTIPNATTSSQMLAPAFYSSPVMVGSAAPQMALALQAGVTTAAQGVISVGSPASVSPIVIQPMADSLTAAASQSLVTIAPKPADGSSKEAEPALSVLLQQKAQNALPQLNWLNMKLKMHYGVHQNCGRPFCKLKRKDHYHCFHCNQAFSEPGRLKSHIVKQGVSLDKIDMVQNFGFGQETPGVEGSPATSGESEKNDTSDADMSEEDLSDAAESSAMKRGPRPMMAAINAVEEDADDEDSTNLVIDFSRSAEADAKDEEMEEGKPGDEDGRDINGLDGSEETPARRSSRKRTATRHNDFVDSNMALTVKRQRLPLNPHSGSDECGRLVTQDMIPAPRIADPKVTSPKAATPKAMALKPTRSRRDDSIPEGCEKFRFTEDCGRQRCSYRLSQTHYHCLRENCGYGFGDRSRFYQHLDRHKRLDGLMGDEFKMFRMGQDCGRPDCEHMQKASHFHCMKCPFICTDSSKVTAHRKHHSKMDVIAAQGFTKYTAADPCGKDGCSHAATHYHCRHCAYVATGPAQMNTHKNKHAIEEQKMVAVMQYADALN